MQKQTYLILIRRTDYGARQMLKRKSESDEWIETERGFNLSCRIKAKRLRTK